eukprot:3112742-Pyramimonas_sp.AAC.1
MRSVRIRPRHPKQRVVTPWGALPKAPGGSVRMRPLRPEQRFAAPAATAACATPTQTQPFVASQGAQRWPQVAAAAR